MLFTVALLVTAGDLAVASGPAQAVVPDDPPATHVTVPARPTPTTVTVRGTASDDIGVSRVTVTVKDRTTGLYWNPATDRWQAQWLWYDADISSARARSTGWAFAFDPGRSGSGRYRTTAVAWDTNAQRDPGIARRDFRIDATALAPTATITVPVAGSQMDAGPITLAGAASDDHGIDRVMVTIRDMVTRRIWNPDAATWQDGWRWDRTTLEGARWSSTFDPTGTGGSGQYRASVVPWDSDGLRSPSPTRVVFSAPSEGPVDPPPGPGGRTLVWSDEFGGSALDPNHWKPVTGLYGTPYTVQNYTARPENVRVENGNLVLEAHREASNGQPYTSGMVVSNDLGDAAASSTRGNTAWTYGRFEMRARVPDGSGLWPAFWMRPETGAYGGWPRSGEIDILEYAGPTTTSWNDRRIVHDLHWWDATARDNNGSFGHYTPVSTSWLDQFHTFAVEWDAQGFRWYVDGQLTHQAGSGWSAPGGPAGAPFDQAFFITLNLQIGGWSGTPNPAAFPDTYEIDWVRVYQ